MSDHRITINESIAMFEVSRSVKPWDHLKDEVVAPMLEAARLVANPNIKAAALRMKARRPALTNEMCEREAIAIVAAALTPGDINE